ncbi:MAG: DUF4124 domain-containing protein [Gammaproteobacteria bacterium]|jgi:hypothetical protein|nr:DUF4124 domain-containing protein [Gammaproteobacteria bacterium]
MNLIAHALAVLLASVPAVSAAGQVYRWVDADGTVQYSERPPVGVRAEPIPLHYAPASRDQAADELKRLRERSGLGGAPAAPPAPAQGQPSPEQRAEQDRQRAENCRTAQENLRVLETTQRVMAKDAQGNEVRLDDSQKQARLEETRRQIEKFCGP